MWRIVILTLLSLWSSVPLQSVAKAGPASLFLRDDATGEWLLGVMGERAVYGKRLWTCTRRSANRYSLTSAGDTIDVSLNRGKAVIDGHAYRVSVVSGPCMPAYPCPSDDTIRCGATQVADTVTFICVTRSRRQYYDTYELTDDSVPGSVACRPERDSLGCAVVRHATRRLACLRLISRAGTMQGGLANVMAYCNPGDTAVVCVDDIGGRAYFMGSLSRVNNELLVVRATSFYTLSFHVQTAGLDSALAAFGRSYARSRQKVDSVCAARPSLSAATRRCLDAYCRFCYAFECMYKMQSELLSDNTGPLFREFVSTKAMPAVCRRVVDGFSADYARTPFVPSWAATAFRQVYAQMRFVLQNALVPAAECPAYKPGAVSLDTTETEGRRLFEELVRPYRGKVVYVDVWGGWCAPCLAELRHVREVREAMRGEDVMFMFLANKTDGRLYRELAGRLGLCAPGSVSFNLPPGRQAAIERYLAVSSFPYHIMLDRHGNPVVGEIPRLSQPEELRRLIKDVAGR